MKIDDEEKARDDKERTADCDVKEKYSERYEEIKGNTPILLMEECGVQVRNSKLRVEHL